MFLKRMLFVLVIAVLLCSCTKGDATIDQLDIFHNKRLEIAVVAGAPGSVEVGGKQFGFCRELLAAYAEARGLDIEFVENLPLNSLAHRLRFHLSDVGIVLSDDDASPLFDKMTTVMLATTNFVMVARNSDSVASLHISQIAGEGAVAISPAFQNTVHYDAMLDSLSRAQLYVSPKNCRELAQALRTGEYDFMICEAGNAAMLTALDKNLRVVYRFDEPIDVHVVFPQRAGLLYENFCEWWAEYSAGPEYQQLRQAYFDNNFRKHLRSVSRRPHRLNGISVWDEVIRRVGEREGVDWRLLSAIAFEESMFRSDVKSARGATGLMQIMPITARHFNVDQESLADPETNVTVAAKLLKSIENDFEFPDSVALDDKLGIILAAYNCGQKTVSDAVAIAAAIGRNPYEWSAVAECLRLMGSENFNCDAVTFRRFKGFNETESFVHSVLDRFDYYCRSVQ